jgi:hypothetical protein
MDINISAARRQLSRLIDQVNACEQDVIHAPWPFDRGASAVASAAVTG